MTSPGATLAEVFAREEQEQSPPCPLCHAPTTAHLLALLDAHAGNVSRVARALARPYQTVLGWLSAYRHPTTGEDLRTYRDRVYPGGGQGEPAPAYVVRGDDVERVDWTAPEVSVVATGRAESEDVVHVAHPLTLSFGSPPTRQRRRVRLYLPVGVELSEEHREALRAALEPAPQVRTESAGDSP